MDGGTREAGCSVARHSPFAILRRPRRRLARFPLPASLFPLVARIAIYAGSFDPITRGHEDIMVRSLEFVDRVVVAVATNVAKQPLFTVRERVDLVRAATVGQQGIDVRAFDGLLVDFAREIGASLLIRGLRAVSDFEYEYQMALMNRHLSARLETVFMIPSLETTYISASLVREVARFGGDVSELVHPEIARALQAKFGQA
jgi:pantetheine-phosphate adenylyltransferase